MADYGRVEQAVFTIPENSTTTSHESATAGMPGRKPPGTAGMPGRKSPGTASLQREGSD